MGEEWELFIEQFLAYVYHKLFINGYQSVNATTTLIRYILSPKVRGQSATTFLRVGSKVVHY